MNILTFSTLFPNASRPNHGIFVETRLRKLIERHPVNARVVAPIPWFPFKSSIFGRYSEFARAPKYEKRHGLEVCHPRYPLIPKIGMNITPRLMANWTLKSLAKLHSGDFKIDLIDAHYFYPDGVAASLLSQMLGIPFVVTARGSDINLFPNYTNPRRQIIQAANSASQIITVSEALRAVITKLGINAEKIVTLRNGVDLDVFKPPDDRQSIRSRLNLKRRTFLSVGNLISLKGHDIVIRALAMLPDVDLIIIGDGPDQAHLKRLTLELQVDSRVRFTGNIPQVNLVDYYGAADALILASEREGWPNVLLESMACGCPVIASSVSGIPEVIRDKTAGLLLKERSPKGIVQAVEKLFAKLPTRADTHSYAAQFDWDAISDGQWAIFNQFKASNC